MTDKNKKPHHRLGADDEAKKGSHLQDIAVELDAQTCESEWDMGDCWEATLSDDQLLGLAKLPPNLSKALVDSWWYLVRLRTRELFAFRSARIVNADWLTLIDAIPHRPLVHQLTTPMYTWGRDVDVRISEILWVGDCDS